MKNKLLYVSLLLMTVLPFASAAHYIVGQVNGTAVNGLPVYLYTPQNGVLENISDIIGATGNSHADNIYMLDCEMLYNCQVGDEVRVTVDGTDFVSVTITGYGYDVAPTIYYNESVVTIPDQDIRLDTLEQNQISILSRLSDLELWKNSVISTIADIFSKLTNHENRIKALEDKVTALEQVTPAPAVVTNSPDYIKYLNLADRKNLICNYAKSNNLSTFSDLNVKCNVIYNRKGVGTCSCKEI